MIAESVHSIYSRENRNIALEKQAIALEKTKIQPQRKQGYSLGENSDITLEKTEISPQRKQILPQRKQDIALEKTEISPQRKQGYSLRDIALEKILQPERKQRYIHVSPQRKQGYTFRENKAIAVHVRIYMSLWQVKYAL